MQKNSRNMTIETSPTRVRASEATGTGLRSRADIGRLSRHFGDLPPFDFAKLPGLVSEVRSLGCVTVRSRGIILEEILKS